MGAYHEPSIPPQDRTGTSVRQVKLAVAVEGVGLEQPGISGQMVLRMLALAIAGVIEHRRRRRCPTERPVVADIDPTSPRIGLAFSQDRDGRIVTMQAFRRHDMGLDPSQQRSQRSTARSHGIGHGREADRHTLQSIALSLPVQRLMLAELLEQYHRQQAGPRPSPREHMERRWRLADLLAIPTGELLPYRLDHLPLARDHLQSPGHVLAQLAQARAAAALTSRRRIEHHALARQMLGEGAPLGALAGEARHARAGGDGNFGRELIFGGTRLQFFELQRQLIDEPLRPFGARAIDLPLQLCDPQLLVRDQGQVFRRLGPRYRQFRRHVPHPGALEHQRRLQRIDIVGHGCKFGVHDQK